ncbi:MAG: LacI family DNA-binding transcriptional regulator [Clostridia bacterium]|nr:LacI family DNA-binding transcriptional regulator [Clostridia bacterium]
MKQTTIVDIAKAAGVSAYTVSKALNGQEKISAQTRERILKLAKEMDYRPNLSAKRLRGGTYRIHVIYPKEPAEFYQYWISGVQNAVQKIADDRLHVSYFPCRHVNAADGYRDALEQTLSASPDGVILVNCYPHAEYTDLLLELTARHIPIITSVIGADDTIPVLGHVAPDPVLIGTLAAELFSGFSVRHPAIFAGHLASDLHKQSIAAFMESAENYHLSVCGCFETDEDPQTAYQQTGKLFSEHPAADGIYVTSYNAAGVCSYLEDHNMKDRVCVIGCDLYPALNQKLQNGSLRVSIFQHQDILGACAVQYLYEYLCGVRTADQCALRHVVQPVFPCMLPYYQKFL